MKKIQKTKKGFTLVEMVLVIAIIVILAAILVIGITKYINAAKQAQASLSMHDSSIGEVNSAITANTNINMGSTI